jgi:hypothetical protein
LVTVQDIKAQFPEFANATDALVQAFLSSAILRCPVAVWGTLTDEGVKWTTVSLLAQSPMARSMELAADGTSVYDAELLRLKRTISAGGRVI